MEVWDRYWFKPAPAESAAIVRIVCCSLCFLIYARMNIRPWAEVSTVFWTPISFFRMLPGAPQNAALLGLVQTLWKGALIASAVGLLTRLSLITSALLGFFVLGLPNCYGKIHHLDGFAVLLLFILSVSRCDAAWTVDRWLRKPRTSPHSPSGDYAWANKAAQILFLLIFFAAGWSKLRHSGWAWMQPDNMRFLLLGNVFVHEPPTRWGALIASSDLLCSLAAAATLVAELSALPAIFVPALRIPVVIALFGLQTGISLVMGIYFVPHLVGYALFIPWDSIVSRQSEIRRRLGLVSSRRSRQTGRV